MDTGTQYDDRAQAHQTSPQLDASLALDAARIGAWQWDPAADAMICNERMRRLCGITRDAVVTLDVFLKHVRSEDRGRTRDALLQSLRDGITWGVECSLVDSGAGTDRWIIIEGRPCALAGSKMQMLGTVRDISARKLADAQRELDAREMEHRLQNVFTVVTAMVSLAQRFASTPEQLADSLHARIGALARAHGLLQNARSGRPISLQSVIESELAPFADLGRISIYGPRLRLGSRQAAAMNMIVHELTTNAVKHGALSQPAGRVAIDWAIEPSMSTACLVLRWKERCSRAVAAPSGSGLGLKLLSSNARGSLRGDILLEFDSTGLLATLIAPVHHLTDNDNA